MEDHKKGKKHKIMSAAVEQFRDAPRFSRWGDYFAYEHRRGFRILLKRKELEEQQGRRLTNSQWTILVDSLREWYEAHDFGDLEKDQDEAQAAYIKEGVLGALQILFGDAT